MSMNYVLAVVLGFALTGSPMLASADHKDDDQEWKQQKKKHHKKKHGKRGRYEARYEDDDGDCRIKVKWSDDKYEEKRRCKNRGPGRAQNAPPPWAPAWGYRRKHGASDYQGAPAPRDDTRYDDTSRQLGILEGTCRREALGGILGGATGGALGSRIGDGTGQIIATIAGTVVGYLVGSSIGRYMDQMDRQCVGQALERAGDGQMVVWRNPDNGDEYRVTPRRTFQRQGRYCRDYDIETIAAGADDTARATACRSGDGSWQSL